jgi:hypothetical protein
MLCHLARLLEETQGPAESMEDIVVRDLNFTINFSTDGVSVCPAITTGSVMWARGSVPMQDCPVQRCLHLCGDIQAGFRTQAPVPRRPHSVHGGIADQLLYTAQGLPGDI